MLSLHISSQMLRAEADGAHAGGCVRGKTFWSPITSPSVTSPTETSMRICTPGRGRAGTSLPLRRGRRGDRRLRPPFCVGTRAGPDPRLRLPERQPIRASCAAGEGSCDQRPPHRRGHALGAVSPGPSPLRSATMWPQAGSVPVTLTGPSTAGLSPAPQKGGPCRPPEVGVPRSAQWAREGGAGLCLEGERRRACCVCVRVCVLTRACWVRDAPDGSCPLRPFLPSSSRRDGSPRRAE